MTFTVILAVDPSSQCDDAIKYYMSDLHRPDNQIVLAHAVEVPDDHRQLGVFPQAVTKAWEEGQKDGTELLDKIKAFLVEQGITNEIKVRQEPTHKAGQFLVSVANEEKANMIVMGTRGMGKFRRTLLGSVSDYLLHHAHCPVVVCRPAKK